jgi:hypothetical protein
MDRVLASAESRTDYRTDGERRETLDYLQKARDFYSKRASPVTATRR